jgi:serine/threonine protein kinase
LQSISPLSKGDRVDHFEIRELIGEGGMGAIYRAVDTRLGRVVAFKIVRGGEFTASFSEMVRQRFLREALAMSRVEHRNIVRILDFGFSGVTPYLAMEYLRGRDLGKLIQATEGFLPVPEVIDLMLSVCAAIRACHDAGIIHRDLKPSNIFLCDSDNGFDVKVLDFGISKAPLLDGDLTKDGQIVGTPQFLAPEQLTGRSLPQTDQYAIGVVLYECLTKSLPYQSHAILGLLRAIDEGDFTPPTALRGDIPKELEAVILRAMRPLPEDRFPSVHALGRALWPFASPHAHERWRAYFSDERRPEPADASIHGMPLIEALVRGLPAPPGPAAAAAAPRPALGIAERPGFTQPETPEAPASVSSGASTRPTGGRKTKVVASLVVGAALVAGAAWWALQRQGTPAVPPPPPTTGDVPRSAPPAPLPQPAAPAGDVQPPAAPARADDAPRSASESRTAPPKRGKPHRPHGGHPAPVEHASDGVPIMP